MLVCNYAQLKCNLEISSLIHNPYKYYLQMKEHNYAGMETHIYWTIQGQVQRWTLVHGYCLIG